ncbi:hypothetical protein T02_10456 [Trichinella nativa]|uniref:Uncharacterized protein n=1 Tax=Trichinella nativa TaxID=6335 RepID=A0A0V1LNY8_9BILA|nr:hypothetical protein T02_10456 [Trichinella nativa]
MVVKCGFSAATGQKGRGYQKSPGDLPLFYQVLFPDIKLTMHVKANDLTTQSRLFQGRNLAENSATVEKSCIVLLHAVGVQRQLRADKGSGSRMKSMEVAEAERAASQGGQTVDFGEVTSRVTECRGKTANVQNVANEKQDQNGKNRKKQYAKTHRQPMSVQLIGVVLTVLDAHAGDDRFVATEHQPAPPTQIQHLY